jgi:hypothetical protein
MLCKEIFDVLCKKHQQRINTIRGPADDLVLIYPTWCVLGEIMLYNDHIFVTSGGSIIVCTKRSSRKAHPHTHGNISRKWQVTVVTGNDGHIVTTWRYKNILIILCQILNKSRLLHIVSGVHMYY